MSNWKANHLPAHLRGAYVHFNNALLKHHGITIRPAKYLQLSRKAAWQAGAPAHGGRCYVTLPLDGRAINCIYDPRNSALITVFRRPDV